MKVVAVSNFGIPYGRGAKAIALQVLAETGTDTPLSQLEEELELMVTTWKTVSYPTAWAFMEECADAVEHPGYLINPWGRMRRFSKPINDEQLESFRREAQNFKVQSTVSDTIMIAMQLMVEYRRKHKLHFKMINQVHDAMMLVAPKTEIEQTEEMFNNTMGNILIPIRPGHTLQLGVDITIFTRWGEKMKKQKKG